MMSIDTDGRAIKLAHNQRGHRRSDIRRHISERPWVYIRNLRLGGLAGAPAGAALRAMLKIFARAGAGASKLVKKRRSKEDYHDDADLGNIIQDDFRGMEYAERWRCTVSMPR